MVSHDRDFLDRTVTITIAVEGDGEVREYAGGYTYYLNQRPAPDGKNLEFFVSDEAPDKKELRSLHRALKKVEEDIQRFSFNTAVSTFMICVNELTEFKCNKKAVLEPLCVALSPYAPHIAEELWSLLGHAESIVFVKFPAYDPEHISDDTFAYPISFNGRTRFNLELSLSLSNEQVEKEVMNAEEVQKWLQGKQPRKIIVVQKKIVNIVV